MPRGKKELAILKLRELRSSWGEARPLPMAVKKIGVTERLTRSSRPRCYFKRWQQHTNTIRPHSALGYRPPAPLGVAGPLEGKILTKDWRHSLGQVSFMPFAHRVGFSGWHPPTPATLSHDKSSNLSCKRIGAGLLLSPRHAQASHEPDGLLRAVPLVVQHQRAAGRFFQSRSKTLDFHRHALSDPSACTGRPTTKPPIVSSVHANPLAAIVDGNHAACGWK